MTLEYGCWYVSLADGVYGGESAPVTNYDPNHNFEHRNATSAKLQLYVTYNKNRRFRRQVLVSFLFRWDVRGQMGPTVEACTSRALPDSNIFNSTITFTQIEEDASKKARH